VGHFGVGFAAFWSDRDKEPIGIVRKLRYKTSFLLGKLRAGRTPPRRFTVLAHRRAAQRQHTSQRRLGGRMSCKKSVGTVDQHTAKLEGLRRQAQRAISLTDHMPPHIIKRVGQQR
jgi:hypothetical protein